MKFKTEGNLYSTSDCNQFIRSSQIHNKITFIDYLTYPNAQKWLDYLERIGYEYTVEGNDVIIELCSDTYKKYLKFIMFRWLTENTDSVKRIVTLLDNVKPNLLLAPLYADHFYSSTNKAGRLLSNYQRFLFGGNAYNNLYFQTGPGCAVAVTRFFKPITVKQFLNIGDKHCINSARVVNLQGFTRNVTCLHSVIEQNDLDYSIYDIEKLKKSTDGNYATDMLNDDLIKEDIQFDSSEKDFLKFYKFYIRKCKSSELTNYGVQFNEFFKNK